MIDKIQESKQKDGQDILKVFLTPTKNFPNGSYFYTSSQFVDIVNSFNWCSHKESRTNHGTSYIVTSIPRDKRSLFSDRNTYEFHLMVYKNKYGKFLDSDKCIDHYNSVQFDNIESNLKCVSSSQNSYNNFSRGYQVLTPKGKPVRFLSRVWVDNHNMTALQFKDEIYENTGVILKTGDTRFKLKEDTACIVQNFLETEILPRYLDNYYLFDFYNFRRYDLDILDSERTGLISKDEAIFNFINRYKDNAWFYYRYNLKEYFKEHNLPVPKYDLDSDGFMVDIITRKKLCPIHK